jgi:hypothetical protein
MNNILTLICSNDITITIVEVDDDQAVLHTSKRFQIVIEHQGKKILPMLKNKYMKYEKNDYIYTITDDNNQVVTVCQDLFFKLMIFNRTFGDCKQELIELLKLNSEDMMTRLREKYSVN